MCNVESRKRTAKVQILKKTTGLCHSRSYYSMVIVLLSLSLTPFLSLSLFSLFILSLSLLSYRAGASTADPPWVAKLLSGLQQVPVPSDQIVPPIPVKVAAESAHLTCHPSRYGQLKEAHAIPQDPRSWKETICKFTSLLTYIIHIRYTRRKKSR